MSLTFSGITGTAGSGTPMTRTRVEGAVDVLEGRSQYHTRSDHQLGESLSSVGMLGGVGGLGDGTSCRHDSLAGIDNEPHLPALVDKKRVSLSPLILRGYIILVPSYNAALGNFSPKEVILTCEDVGIDIFGALGRLIYSLVLSASGSGLSNANTLFF